MRKIKCSKMFAKTCEELLHCKSFLLFSWPGRSPGRAIVLPPASALALAAAALAKSLTLNFFM